MSFAKISNEQNLASHESSKLIVNLIGIIVLEVVVVDVEVGICDDIHAPVCEYAGCIGKRLPPP